MRFQDALCALAFLLAFGLVDVALMRARWSAIRPVIRPRRRIRCPRGRPRLAFSASLRRQIARSGPVARRRPRR